MSNLTKWTFLLLCAFLASCASSGETVAALGAGVAGLGALFNELAAGGVMTPIQNLQAQHALETIAATVSAAEQAAQLATKTAEAAKSGAVSPTEFATGLGGVAGATAVALNSWRNLTRKKALAKPAA